MANTYTQIHIQAVFAVKHRIAQIHKDWQNELNKYISGIIRHNSHQLLAINGMTDHLYIFFGMRPTQSLSDLMQDIKGNSSKWINDNKLTRAHFEWQGGYGAFSYCRSEVPTIIDYINNQQEHHKKISFGEEYRSLLREFGLEYEEKYLFEVL